VENLSSINKLAGEQPIRNLAAFSPGCSDVMERDHLLALIETNNALEEIGSADAKAISYIARGCSSEKSFFFALIHRVDGPD